MLTRWDPFDEMERLTSRFFGMPERPKMFAPVVDVFEKDDAIELRAELPGVKPEQIELDVTDNVLTLSGERKLEHEDEREGYRRIERSYGQFSRSFTLPPNIDKDNIKAEMNDGVLRLTLPKRETHRGRRIEVLTGQKGQPQQLKEGKAGQEREKEGRAQA